eukprot:TRINITY_DN5562_c0_g1_i1.p1 TRINITY_DN5562_c0_g1~~TRINITY_DN5562_c0_g1_i1.p1  ORF type:complete len:839 (+),score=197.97 TRINITY_DN5562_c0_g1_i1:291-2519(+)
MGWNDDEQLVIILKNALIFSYDLFGEQKLKLDLSEDFKKETILDAKVFGSGYVLYSNKKSFYCVIECELYNVTPRTSIDKPLSWVVVEPDPGNDYSLRLIVSESSALSVFGLSKPNPSVPRKEGYRLLALSPSKKYLAAYSEAHVIWIFDSEFSKELVSFTTNAKYYPDEFLWCGEVGVVCNWRINNVLLLVGMTGDYVKYQDNQPSYLFPECDGLRIYTIDSCEFMFPVPISILKVFHKHIERNPGATLFSAAQLFKKEKVCVEDTMQELKKGPLLQAIEIIMDAAANEWDVSLQKELLKAVTFGINYLDKATASIERLRETTKSLRVLNAMRKFGIPLSNIQYKILTPQVLIDRLIYRSQYVLAHEICQYLGLRTDKVLLRWAKKRVSTFCVGESDEDIAKSIKNRLKNAEGVSFASISLEAYRIGREDLAVMLLDAEPNADDQIPLLVHMRKYEMAIEKAIQSGDTNLIFMALSVFRYDTEQGMGNTMDFENLLRRLRPARAIWTQYCKATNLETLIKMYGKEKLPIEVARFQLYQGYYEDNPEETQTRLRLIADMLKKSSSNRVEARLTEDELALYKVQLELEESLGVKFVGSSLTNTLYRAILMGASKRAKKIRADFKVPNKRWWWIKVRALAETGRWEALRSFSNPNKHPSPIGYKPFVEACIQNGNSAEAVYYMQFLPNDEIKVTFYVQLQAWNEALEAAENVELSDNIFHLMKSKVKDPIILKKIESLYQKQRS